MWEFYQPWERRVGVVTLALSCVLMIGWLRSRTIADGVSLIVCGYDHHVTSCRGEVRWGSCPVDLPNIPWRARFSWWSGESDSTEANPYKWKPFQAWEYQGFSIGLNVWIVSYRSLVIPLTLLSAYLLLSEPQAKPALKNPDPWQPTRAR